MTRDYRKYIKVLINNACNIYLLEDFNDVKMKDVR